MEGVVKLTDCEKWEVLTDFPRKASLSVSAKMTALHGEGGPCDRSLATICRYGVGGVDLKGGFGRESGGAVRGPTARLSSFLDGLGHIPANRAELADRNIFQSPSPPIQTLVDLDRGLLHEGVGVLAAAKEDEIGATRQTRVAIVAIEGQTQ
jgi:hypothetical protein